MLYFCVQFSYHTTYMLRRIGDFVLQKQTTTFPVFMEFTVHRLILQVSTNTLNSTSRGSPWWLISMSSDHCYMSSEGSEVYCSVDCWESLPLMFSYPYVTTWIVSFITPYHIKKSEIIWTTKFYHFCKFQSVNNCLI